MGRHTTYKEFSYITTFKRFKIFIDPFDCSAESTGMEELLQWYLKQNETRRVTVKHYARSKE